MALPAVAGIGVIGGLIFWSTRSSEGKSSATQRLDRAKEKKSDGLGGAGIGGNATSGGHDQGHSNSFSQGSPDTPGAASGGRVDKDVSLDKLPAGGVGGGVGAGGMNVRAIEKTAKSAPGEARTGSETGVSQRLSSLFSTGGSSAGEGNEPEAKNTKVSSNLTRTPTKKSTIGHDQHQARVGGDTGN